MFYKKIVLISFLLSCLVPSAQANLEQSIINLIIAQGFKQSGVGLQVQEISSQTPVVSINRNKLFTPASVVKLATTYAALSTLGGDYNWPTEFYTNGKLKNGTLEGNLVVKAYGDPNLVTEDLDIIAQTILRNGIQKITGQLIIDRNYFKVGNKNSSGFDENLHRPYNAMADAMMFNHRASKMTITPNKKENKIEVLRALPDNSYVILNQLKPSKKSCRGAIAWPHVTYPQHNNKPAIKLTGTYSLHCPNRDMYEVLTKPYYMFFHALKFKLSKIGIQLQGTLQLAGTPKSSKKIFTFYSKSLLEIISKINKKSNNLMARQTLLTLGAKKYGTGASYSNGVKAVNSVLSQHNISQGAIKIENGSGLSRMAKLNTATLNKLLQHAYQKYGTSWRNTLAVMGVDGTLRKRLRHSPLVGKAWMKTGSLKRTRSIAGYVKGKSGKLYTVVMLHNAAQAQYKGRKLQDDILQLIHLSL